MSARLILASSSPRRRELLAGILGEVAVRAADVDEQPLPGEGSEALVTRLAAHKAETIAAAEPGAIVIGADTVVVVDGEILSKPIDADDAARMLERLSGRSHDVVTGLAIAGLGPTRVSTTTTVVTMRPIDAAEVGWYVRSGEPMDKAGGYAIQGRAALFVTGIEGSYPNVVGLPLHQLDAMLRALGHRLLDFRPIESGAA